MVVAFDDEEKIAKLSLRQTEILQKLSTIVDGICADCPDTYVGGIGLFIVCCSESLDSVTPPTFHPEYGRYMLESTPGSPYTGSIRDLLSVEGNMRYRYVVIFCPQTVHSLQHETDTRTAAPQTQ